jgi:hypothetical protein
MRNVTDILKDAAVAKRARRTYLAMSAELDQLAGDLQAAGRPLGAAIARQNAYIAYRAARAEYHDPEPDWDAE